MKKLISAFSTWLPLSLTIVCTFGVMYLAIQQYIRLSANEMPMQFALDAKNKLERGTPPTQVITAMENVDLQKSLSPFIMVYNKEGALLLSSATLHGTAPVIPFGVLKTASQNGENRRTWQPEPGVRIAVVALPCAVNGAEGFVVAGRSLKETEMREHFLLQQIAPGMLFTLIATFVFTFIIQLFKNRLPTVTA